MSLAPLPSFEGTKSLLERTENILTKGVNLVLVNGKSFYAHVCMLVTFKSFYTEMALHWTVELSGIWIVLELKFTVDFHNFPIK